MSRSRDLWAAAGLMLPGPVGLARRRTLRRRCREPALDRARPLAPHRGSGPALADLPPRRRCHRAPPQRIVPARPRRSRRQGNVAEHGPRRSPSADLERLLERLRRQPVPGSRGARWLRDLPWYVMIGPPGAGKATALILRHQPRFPHRRDRRAGRHGGHACLQLAGQRRGRADRHRRALHVGGKRRRDRRRCLAALSGPAPPPPAALPARRRARRAARAGADRRPQRRWDRPCTGDRLAPRRGLERQLGLRLPIYLVLTKADLVAGFSEFFAALERGRAQPGLGCHPAGLAQRRAAGSPNAQERSRRHRGETGSLSARGSSPRREVDHRALTLGFPFQIRSLAGDALRMVDGIADAWPAPGSPWLRGVYLTSAAQGGIPVDRLSTILAGGLGLPIEPRPDPLRGARLLPRAPRSRGPCSAVPWAGLHLEPRDRALCPAGPGDGRCPCRRGDFRHRLCLDVELSGQPRPAAVARAEAFGPERCPGTVARPCLSPRPGRSSGDPAGARSAGGSHRTARAPDPWLAFGLSRRATLAAQADAAYEAGCGASGTAPRLPPPRTARDARRRSHHARDAAPRLSDAGRPGTGRPGAAHGLARG